MGEQNLGLSLLAVNDPIGGLGNGFLAEFNFWTILIRVLFCFVFGCLLGIERSNKRHSAGLRTFLLVILASCLAGLMDIYFTINFKEIFPAVSVAAVIAIAIISTNTLLYSSRNQIKGLTTAVALWACAFVGISIGAGLYTIGIIAFVVFYIALNFLPKLEVYLKNRSNHFEIHLELINKKDLVSFTKVIKELGLNIDDIEANPAYANTGISVYTISLTIVSKELKKYKSHKEIIEALATLEYVNSIEEIN